MARLGFELVTPRFAVRRAVGWDRACQFILKEFYRLGKCGAPVAYRPDPFHERQWLTNPTHFVTVQPCEYNKLLHNKIGLCLCTLFQIFKQKNITVCGGVGGGRAGIRVTLCDIRWMYRHNYYSVFFFLFCFFPNKITY